MPFLLFMGSVCPVCRDGSGARGYIAFERKKILASIDGFPYLVTANYSTPFFALLMVPLLAGFVPRNISKQS